MAQEKSNYLQKEKLQSINQLLVTLAALFIVIFGIRFIAQDILAPLLMAIFFSILLFPLYKRFRKKGYSVGISVLFMIATLVIAGGGLILFLTWTFGIFRDSLAPYLVNISSGIDELALSLGITSDTAEEIAREVSPESLISIASNIINRLGGIATYFIFVPILSILILVQADSMPSNLVAEFAGSGTGMTKFKKFAESIFTYVTGRIKVNLVTGILFAICLIILGIDFPFVWGFLTVILSFIPYLGIIIAGIPPTLLAFADYGLTGALLVVGSIALVNLFAENVLDPYIQGRGNKLSTAAVVVTLIFWMWLLGPVGAILSVPLTVLLKIILADYKETAWLAALMEGNYSEAKPVKINKSFSGMQKNVKNLFGLRK